MFKAGVMTWLIWLVLIIGAIFEVGWVLNIIALVHMLGGPVTAMFIARIVGIPVSILGAILGWVS